MTITRNGTPEAAADLAHAMFTEPGRELGREATTILTHAPDTGLVQRREAFRPVYEAIVERIGQPTLLGGAAYGPSVRWCTAERLLLLSGDHGHAALSVHDTHAFARQEWFTFDSTPGSTPDGAHRLGDLPYTWQLDRKGPGQAPSWTYNGMRVADNWEHAQSALELMLASWAEQIPVQAPGDWVGFQLRSARDWNRDMVIAYTHRDHGHEFYAAIYDRDSEQTPQRAAQMRERGWQDLDEHQRWRIRLPETDPQAPATIARVVIADVRARGATCPDELTAWDVSAGDHGDLRVPGIGVQVHPSRGEHY
ncbi:hypothetical protein OHB06_00940 [Streptomyces sp. NBC_01604]|uniref:hypothetical protein n=1 Tax=Streptomyces sp. NBC_01604 TaxID=2975894 RepID=UPI0038696C02